MYHNSCHSLSQSIMFSPPFVILTFALACEALTIPFNQVQNTGPYLQGLPDADRQRATLLKSVGISGTSTIPATNLAFVQYTISVGLGSPATHYELVVDSGSSNTFVGCVATPLHSYKAYLYCDLLQGWKELCPHKNKYLIGSECQCDIWHRVLLG